jgi:hypothetical protein
MTIDPARPESSAHAVPGSFGQHVVLDADYPKCHWSHRRITRERLGRERLTSTIHRAAG